MDSGTPSQPFAVIPHSAQSHFRLALCGVVARLLESLRGHDSELLARHPWLSDYEDELSRLLPAPRDRVAAAWHDALQRWIAQADTFLPLSALCIAGGLSGLELSLLLCVGLAEEDPRFGLLFESGQGIDGQRRPTLSLLIAWWRDDARTDSECEAVRSAVQRLISAGLLQAINPDAPRMDWALSVPALIWDALRGARPQAPWFRCVPREDLLPLGEYLAPLGDAAHIAALPEALATQSSPCLVVRGPRHNGRKTLLGGVAHALGRGALLLSGADDEATRRLIGPLATLMRAMPIVEWQLAAGECRQLPGLSLYDGPVGVVAGLHGGIVSSDVAAALSVTLDLPQREQRLAHWRATLPDHPPEALQDFARQLRLTSGHIRSAAQAARAYARLGGRAQVSLNDVRQACRSAHVGRLDTMATLLPPMAGAWSQVALPDETAEDLHGFEARCRHRETLGATMDMSAGARALFAGPSGTGKTLAARAMAAALGKDLYRLDLSATVNKYLGETEKNLEQVFALAEELDIVLLLDEGDALMTQRTDVQNANDRYANLETNFLLQRIESFGGVLIVTTNAADRIDKAFQRRMDVVIQFRMPDAETRAQLLRLHLPADATVDAALIEDVAYRCQLSGGQIRNVCAHAAVLALDDAVPLRNAHLEAALMREYRKSGAVCPLRRSAQKG